MLARNLMRILKRCLTRRPVAACLACFREMPLTGLLHNLHKDGQTAAIIGTLDFTNAGVHLTGNM